MIFRIRWEGHPDVENELVREFVKGLEKKGIRDVSEAEIVIRYVKKDKGDKSEVEEERYDLEADIETDGKPVGTEASATSDPWRHRRDCSWFEV